MLFSQGSKTSREEACRELSFGICYFHKGAKLHHDVRVRNVPFEYAISTKEKNRLGHDELYECAKYNLDDRKLHKKAVELPSAAKAKTMRKTRK